MTKFFKVPFAVQGDKEDIPETVQGDGSVSYTQGYGIDYERKYADDLAKDIPRKKENKLFHDITEAIGEMQQLGLPRWDLVGRPYPNNATVYHDGKAFISLKAGNNVTPVNGLDWKDITDVLVNAVSETELSSAITATELKLTNGLALKANKSVKINPGVGVSGGGDLSSDRTIGIKFGTTDDTAAQGNDSRIINGQKAFEGLTTGLNVKADKTTKVTAGTGLEGSGTLANDITLDIKFGTVAGTAAQGNDERFDRDNLVYDGTLSENLEYPIGHHLIAWYIGVTPPFNAHTDIYNSTYGISGSNRFVFVSGFTRSDYPYRGTKLNGRWAFRGYVASPASTAAGLFQRIS